MKITTCKTECGTEGQFVDLGSVVVCSGGIPFAAFPFNGGDVHYYIEQGCADEQGKKQILARAIKFYFGTHRDPETLEHRVVPKGTFLNKLEYTGTFELGGEPVVLEEV